MRCVISAITPMTTRIAVTTGTSLTNVSLVQRINANTRRRPSVKLTSRNSPVPSTLCAKVVAFNTPCSARPEVIAMMVHPTVSSMMAEATSVVPIFRRIKFISRTTIATILTDATESAVPRNIEVISRWLGRGSMPTGEDRMLTLRPKGTEYRLTEDNARDQLPHNGRLADPLHELAKKPANQKQQYDLRDEEGFRRNGWRLIRRECRGTRRERCAQPNGQAQCWSATGAQHLAHGSCLSLAPTPALDLDQR